MLPFEQFRKMLHKHRNKTVRCNNNKHKTHPGFDSIQDMKLKKNIFNNPCFGQGCNKYGGRLEENYVVCYVVNSLYNFSYDEIKNCVNYFKNTIL